jgi:hypothetical protein
MKTLVSIPYQPPSPSSQNMLQQLNEMRQKFEAAAQTGEWSQVSDSTNYSCQQSNQAMQSLQNLGQGYALAGLSGQIAGANEQVRPADVTAAAEQIGRLICECDQLRRERSAATAQLIEQAKQIQRLRLLSCVEDTSTDQLRRELKGTRDAMDCMVRADDRVIDKIWREKAWLLDAVRPGVSVEPGDTFDAHLIWWPDELPVPVAVGEQGSRVMKMPEEATTDNPVQSDIDRTLDHLLNGRTTKDQRKDLSKATERAERVPAGDDAAVGRAIR